MATVERPSAPASRGLDLWRGFPTVAAEVTAARAPARGPVTQRPNTTRPSYGCGPKCSMATPRNVSLIFGEADHAAPGNVDLNG